MRILVTNDDGIFAEGILHLAQAAGRFGDVLVVAPDREQSATSHSLTLHRPLRMRKETLQLERPPVGDLVAYAVDGTPTDCVNLAVQGFLKNDGLPDLVLSGINYGPNMGDDVTYSGTVSATFEASLHGLPGIAFSQFLDGDYSFAEAEDMVVRFLEQLFAEGETLPKDLLLNVNLPVGHCRGVRMTRLGKRFYEQTVTEKKDPKGRSYFWIGGTPVWEADEGTDHHAVEAGYISVTPLHLDLTDYQGLEHYAPLGQRLDAGMQPQD